MTKEYILLIAILNEKLDDMEQTHDDKDHPDYYRAIKDVIETIKQTSERV